MMGGFPPDGPPQGGGNFYNNFFNQQEGMAMEGVVTEGENDFTILEFMSKLLF